MSSTGENWLRSAVIYHILVDRFAGFTPDGALGWDLPVFIGGNIAAIASRLDYLEELGINTLWLSPICQTVDYHGYHITDYKSVDHRFGDVDNLRSLITDCHKRCIRVITDFVPNHCHENHPFFREAQRDEDSPYREWFVFDERNNYRNFLGCGWLPKLNLDNKEARAYMIECAIYWLEQGLDGFRIDHVIGMSHGFLLELSSEVKQKNPQCILIGEAVIDRKNLWRHYDTFFIKRKAWRALFGFTLDALQKDYCGVLDGVLDFQFQELMVQYARDELKRPSLERKLGIHFARCPDGFALVLFLDSHDKNRLICECRGREDKLREATEVMLKFAREFGHPVSFYYGYEVLLNQLVPMPENYPHSDLLPRRVMTWTPNQTQAAFYSFLSEQIRKHAGPEHMIEP